MKDGLAPCFLVVFQSYDSDKPPIIIGPYDSAADATGAMEREFVLNRDLDYAFVTPGFMRDDR